MHETGSRSQHHHSHLPPDFHLSPSHRDILSTSSPPFSPALSSPSETPLASYLVQRRRCRTFPPEGARMLAHSPPQVPLSALSPPSVSLGAVGGHFNSTTKIKFVPLPAIFPSNPVRHCGVRSVRVHTDRYLPSSSGRQHHSHSTISESLLHLPSLDNRPRTRLIGQETARQKTREFKSQSGVLPHRVEQPFYMSGHRARIVGKEEKEVSANVVMEEGRRVRFAKDPTLFYGRGLAHHPVASCGGREAVWRFEVRLNTAMERRWSRGPGEDVEDSSKGFTAIVGENEKMSDDSKGHTFLTETRPRTNV